MSLRVLTSSRLESLLADVVALQRDEPLPPLVDETIVVPSQGMRRWLQLRLADELGVAASLQLPFLGLVLDTLADRVLGDRPRTLRDALADDVLEWRIWSWLDTVTESGGAAVRPLRAYLGAARSSGDADRQRGQLAAAIRRCLGTYRLHRADLLQHWENGELGALRSASSRGHAAWQSRLWRDLVTLDDTSPAAAPSATDGDVDLPLWEAAQPRRAGPATGSAVHGAGRLALLARALLDSTRTIPAGDLPPRLTVFGFGRVPPDALVALDALAHRIPVTFLLTVPTPHWWTDVRSAREAAAEPTDAESGPTVLTALGRASRDFLPVLERIDPDGVLVDTLDDLVAPEPEIVATRQTLHVVQDDIRHVVVRDRDARLAWTDARAADRSLTMHACHSPLREMEVVRDQILEAFATDPTLRPEDVVVLVPDVERYAPFAAATFLRDRPGEPRLPVHVADRSLGATGGPAAAFRRALELADGRLQAGDVLELLEHDSVRNRFGLTRTDVGVARDLVRDAGIAWGLDADHRADAFDVPALAIGTWRQGLDRLLAGYAVAAPARSRRTTPIVLAGTDDAVAAIASDTAGARTRTIGRLGEFVDALAELVALRSRRQPLDAWAADLGRALESLTTPSDELEQRQIDALTALFGRLTVAGEHVGDAPAPFGTVRDHVLRQLAADDRTTPFLGGGITMCALQPLRTIPFRVVCIAGLEDGAFPRRDPSLPFDLARREPRAGDPSTRQDDLQLFLDTLLAARDRLVLTWCGRSQKDDTKRAPSLCVAELLDHLEHTFEFGETSAERAFVTEHPLQSFSPRYFVDASTTLFSYAESAAAACRALGEHAAVPTFVEPARFDDPLSEELERRGGTIRVTVAELVSFWRDPCRDFVRRVLEMRLRDDSGALPSAELFGPPKGLDRYLLHELLLDARADRPTRLELEQSRRLPAGSVAPIELASTDRELGRLRDRIDAIDLVEPERVELAGATWSLSGELDPVTPDGVVAWRPAKVKGKDRVACFVRHVVYCAVAEARGEPAAVPASRYIGTDATLEYRRVDDAAAVLERLVHGFARGRVRPAPFWPGPALKWAEMRRKRDDVAARAAARRQLEQDAEFDPFTPLCCRGREPIDATFEQWAEALTTPLLDHERKVDG